MRKIREVSAEEENFRLEKFAPRYAWVKRDPIKPEPEGTIVLLPFKITGYDQDCDGSLMARLSNVGLDLQETGWEEINMGLFGQGFVVTEKELKKLATQTPDGGKDD